MIEEEKTIEDLFEENEQIEDSTPDTDGSEGDSGSNSEDADGEDKVEQGESESSEGEGEGEEGEAEEDNKSALEIYLEAHGIKDRKIKYDDGEEVDFNELDKEEQLNILESLNTPDLSEYLQEDEIGLISYLRENELSIEDFILQEAERLSREFGNDDNLSDDEVYLQSLKEQLPNLNEEELEEELRLAKEGRNYEKKVEALRQLYDDRKKRENAKLEAEALREKEAELEQQKSLIIEEALNIEDFNGFDVTDDMKNEALGYLIELDENQNSKFVNLMSDPNNLFKASLYMLYGDSMFEKLNDYYKDEISRAREQGKREAMEGLADVPVKSTADITGKVKDKRDKSIEDLYYE